MNAKRMYEEDGFVVFRELITPGECAALKTEIARILETNSDHAGVFVGLAANSEVFRDMARDPRVLDAIEGVIGRDIEFLSDKVVFKSAATNFGSPWHQDWPYWKGAHKLSAWFALDPATRANGCLKLLPGSHRATVVHDGAAPAGEGFDHRLRPNAVDESAAVVVECEPGDAVMFHDLTLHASFPNVSGEDRWALISTYRSAREPDLEYEWAVAAEVVRGHRTP